MIDLSLGHYGASVSTPRPRAVRPSSSYGPPLGMPELRAILASRLGVPYESVAIVTGATAGLAASILAGGRPDHLIAPSPGYPGYFGLADALGVDVVKYELNSRRNLEQVLSEVDGRAIALWNSPHNPTGRIEDLSDVRMLDRLAGRSVMLIEDRAYSDLRLPNHAVRRALDVKSSIIVGSLSKALALAGERVGFIVAAPAVLTLVNQAAWRLSMSVSSASQQIAVQTLSDPDLEAQIGARLQHRIRAGQIARAALQLGPPSAEDSYFVWLTFPETELAEERITLACRERGVVVAAGKAFKSADPAIRLSLTSVPLERLTVALANVSFALSELGLKPHVAFS